MLQLHKKSFLTLKQIPKPLEGEFEKFSTALEKLKSQLETHPDASETNIEEYATDFLKDSFSYSLNKSGDIDKTIQIDGVVNVQFEFKAPKNPLEMITLNAPNRKAMQESVYYFMQQRELGNNEIKRIVISNGTWWFVFDAGDFEQLFWQNTAFKKRFKDFESGILTGKKTSHFYNDIAKPTIDDLTVKNNLLEDDATMEPLCFDIAQIKNESDKIAFFKALSKPYLIKVQAKKDPNHLDPQFYTKLLDLMGLEQIPDGGKKIIRRCQESKRKDGSLLENTIASIIRSRRNPPADVENAALSLVIIWINRILFLKLLESQLLRYHANEAKYRFLDFAKISEFDKLNSLFFEALAKQKDKRASKYKHFENIPYLNSSLFELSNEEDSLISISSLEDDPLFDGGHLLKAFFAFLDSYDFGTEVEERIRSENKTLISSAVLGLVFEKINGYRDGSFYTPSFITQYMARESITKAVLQKFNDAKGWECKTLTELYNEIKDKKEANEIFDSITICDPAVGSGHFLVSCLNELLRTKAELGILASEDGKSLKDYSFDIQNDELIVWDEDSGREFAYHEPFGKESARIQKTLFEAKRRIIENQLFGVDINPNSVNICRLRLWIELLKNAYYDETKELQTLPNIDINIKCGNSLMARFDLKDDKQLLEALKQAGSSVERYKFYTEQYKEAKTKEEKRVCEDELNRLRAFVPNRLKQGSPKLSELAKLTKEYQNSYGEDGLSQGVLDVYSTAYKQNALFEVKVDEKAKKALAKKIETLNAEVTEFQSGKIYENAFEWRFEFPEVLDDDGRFVGFDVVIGNPPYIRVQGLKGGFEAEAKYYESKFESATSNYDIYVLFMEACHHILSSNGSLSFILPHKFLISDFGVGIRGFLARNKAVESLLHFGSEMVFEDASTYTCIVTLSHKNERLNFKAASPKNLFDKYAYDSLGYENLGSDKWNLSNSSVAKVFDKVNQQPLKVKDVFDRVFTGIQTSADNIFLLLQTKGGLYSKALDTIVQVEDGLLKPMLKGEDVNKYANLQNKYFVIFPYFIENGKAKAMSEEYIKANFPNGYEYLKANEAALRGREKGRFDNPKEWFLFSRKQGVDGVEQLKIITPDIALKSQMSLDDGKFYHGTTLYSFIKKDEINEDYKFYLAIFNSSLMWFFIQNTSTELRGGYFRFKTAYLEPFPLPKLENLEQQKPFVDLVDKILELKKSGSDTTALETQIDQMVYELYGLSADEIKTIEGEK
jgi:adenine-specific DNA-methyltransferase